MHGCRGTFLLSTYAWAKVAAQRLGVLGGVFPTELRLNPLNLNRSVPAEESGAVNDIRFSTSFAHSTSFLSATVCDFFGAYHTGRRDIARTTT